MQQGRYVGQLIHRRLSGKSAPRPFRYFDKGNMAVVGKGFAVLQSGKIHLSGFFAWLAWAGLTKEHREFSNLNTSKRPTQPGPDIHLTARIFRESPIRSMFSKLFSVPFKNRRSGLSLRNSFS